MLLSKEKMPLMKLVLAILFIFFLIGYSSHKSKILLAELRVFCFSAGIAQPGLRQIRLLSIQGSLEISEFFGPWG